MTIDTASIWLKFLPVLHVLVLVAVSLRIFSRRTAHGTAIAWLLLIVVLPGVGAFGPWSLSWQSVQYITLDAVHPLYRLGEEVRFPGAAMGW